MTELQQKLKGAWTSARAGVTAANQGAEKVLSRLERAVDETVKRAVTRYRIPTRDDLDALQKRLDAISDRVDALSKDKGAA